MGSGPESGGGDSAASKNSIWEEPEVSVWSGVVSWRDVRMIFLDSSDKLSQVDLS